MDFTGASRTTQLLCCCFPVRNTQKKVGNGGKTDWPDNRPPVVLSKAQRKFKTRKEWEFKKDMSYHL